MNKNQVTFVLGGGRSGKSRYALEYANTFTSKAFVATAEAFDSEMEERIQRHQKERDPGFITIEEPLDLAKAIKAIPESIEIILIDCLTVWLGNLMYHKGIQNEPYLEVKELVEILKNPPCEIILVSNETGLGIIPGDPVSRAFRDHAGWLNQDIAGIADRVVFMVSGLPLMLKTSGGEI